MIKENSFKPHKFYSNAHWQSMWPTFIMRKRPDLKTTRERLELLDGDFVDLEWLGKEGDPIVILLHGVTGHITSPYIKYMMPALVKHGWRAVMMYYRGYSGSHNRSDVMTHAGSTSEFSELVCALHKRYPKTLLAALGFSQGANMLLKYLGEQGSNTFLKCAVAVSPPFQLRSISNRVRRGMSRFYQWYLLRDLKRFYKNKFQYRTADVDLTDIDSYNSFWQFDDKITAPINGFLGAVDYYRQASCYKYLKKIDIPTLILHAKDDPIMTPDIIPTYKDLSESTIMELSETGGHLGFVEGTLRHPKFWLEERIPQFLEEYLPTTTTDSGQD